MVNSIGTANFGHFNLPWSHPSLSSYKLKLKAMKTIHNSHAASQPRDVAQGAGTLSKPQLSSDLSDNSSLQDPICKAVYIWPDWNLKCKIPFPRGYLSKLQAGVLSSWLTKVVDNIWSKQETKNLKSWGMRCPQELIKPQYIAGILYTISITRKNRL